MNTIIKPMLAYKVDKKPIDWTKKVYMQPKLDGVRCVATIDGCYTRNGKQLMNVEHIELSLKPWFDMHPEMILDGELYNHDLRDDFEKIISLVRKQKPTEQDRLEASNMMQYHVYDYITEDNDDEYETRYAELACFDFYDECIKYVPTTLVSSYKEALMIHKVQLAQGYEGSILRLNENYEQKRSYNLQKFKDFHDTEATIIGYVVGKGKRTGTLGKFLMRDTKGIEFGCPPGKGYNYKDLANMLDNIDDYLGKTATFTYFERTKANSYRHPLFKTLRNYE
jgi:DNA ligase 1